MFLISMNFYSNFIVLIFAIFLFSCCAKADFAKDNQHKVTVLFVTGEIVNEYIVLVCINEEGDYWAILSEKGNLESLSQCQNFVLRKEYILTFISFKSPRATSKSKDRPFKDRPTSFSITAPYGLDEWSDIDSIVVIWRGPEAEFAVPTFTSPQVVGAKYCPNNS